MGSKLPVLAAAQLIAIATAAAQPQSDVMKQGIDAYKAGDYDKAAGLLERAYKADAKPETLFALAQAERLGGHCDKAIPHYKKLLEKTTDLAQAKLIQNNLGLCEASTPPPPPPPEPGATTAEPPKPEVVTKTVVRETHKTDKLATVMLAGGMLAIGGGVGLYVVAKRATSDARVARTLEIHDSLLDRASRDRVLGYVALGAGAALITGAIVKWSLGSSTKSEVALVPSAHGATFALSGRF